MTECSGISSSGCTGLPQWLSSCQSRRGSLDPWVGKTPYRRKQHSTPESLPGEHQGQRSLAGHSAWGQKEQSQTQLSDYTTTTKWPHNLANAKTTNLHTFRMAGYTCCLSEVKFEKEIRKSVLKMKGIRKEPLTYSLY